MPYHVIILRANGNVERNSYPKKPELSTLQAAVGGYIQTVPYFTKLKWPDGTEYKRGTCYANEEGILKGLYPNGEATRAWRDQFPQATMLHGDVVFYAKVK